MNAPPPPTLLHRRLTPTASDLALLRTCFEANGLRKDLGRLAWQYVENPAGPAVAELAIDASASAGGRLAAVYATMPVRARLDGRDVLAMQSVDTLTDARYRRLGLFTAMAERVYAACAHAGAAFVYGFPNGNSAHGIFRSLGWTALDPVPILALPLRTGYVLRRLAGLGRPDVPLPRLGAPPPVDGEEVVGVDRFDERFDALWAEVAPSLGVAVVRDRAYLDWRLARRPGSAYRTLAWLRRDRLRGFVSWTLADKHGGRMGYVMELLAAPGEDRVRLSLLRRAVRDLAQQGADAALAWSLGHAPGRGAYLRTGFLTLPARFWPVELHFGARALAEPAAAPRVLDRSRWYLSYCDSDTV